ncbi:hypothetical protein KFE25_006732 [Diacronema lutheri]|uniref:Methylenetetrahydrofolate reductase (NAD(P)H) n=1 Tax=Diacronema lutheri TaxID=2081491 RepID=A0A8J5XY98_DIALT|nr:hypothetical protein KFE25_006732 [Diacronema lutheri]
MLFRHPFTIELMPRVVLQESNAPLLRRIPPGTRVFLPHLPTTAVDELVAASVAVLSAGLRPVPHIAARRWRHASEAERALHALSRSAGQSADGLELLVIGGTERSQRNTADGAVDDADDHQPPFVDSLALITSGLLSAANVRAVAIASHPEGMPGVPRAIADRALSDKVAALRAASIQPSAVTQVCFDASALRAHVLSLPALGLRRASLSVVGPVQPAVLAKYARACGVAPPKASPFGAPPAYSPGAFLRELEALSSEGRDGAPAAHGEPATAVELAMHVFPFGGLAATLDWLELEGGQLAAPAGAGALPH